jgi:hypothetical protein
MPSVTKWTVELGRQLDEEAVDEGGTRWCRSVRRDVAYYASWGNLAIFCKDFGYGGPREARGGSFRRGGIPAAGHAASDDSTDRGDPRTHRPGRRQGGSSRLRSTGRTNQRLAVVQFLHQEALAANATNDDPRITILVSLD